LVGYSFGSLITLELAKELEKHGMNGHVVLIDGAPKFLKKLTVEQKLFDFSDASIQSVTLMFLIQILFPDDTGALFEHILTIASWEDKVTKLMEFSKDQNIYTEEYVRNMLDSLVARIKLVLQFEVDDMPTLENTSITLIRPSEVSLTDIDEDYGLGQHTKQKVNLKFVSGNHMTMLDNPKLIEMLNELDPVKADKSSFISYMNSDEKDHMK
jgi:fatty acid synthase